MTRHTPFFSIGITTYNQPDLLKQALESILDQTFSDVEVIVGNDNPGEFLSLERFGLHDSRIRFINHPENLGERGNMNSLLAMSRGRYFTWLADDDFYAPGFLKTLNTELTRFNFPPCAFTSYVMRDDSGAWTDKYDRFSGTSRLLAGSEFVRMYFGGTIRAIGTCGMFEAGYIRTTGGVEKLGNGPFALYSEYLLLMKAALLEQVLYIDSPLVTYRVHENSWGCSNLDLEEYKVAGRQLIKKCADLFEDPMVVKDYRQNLADLSRLHWSTFISKTLFEASEAGLGIPALTLLFRRASEAESHIREILSEIEEKTRKYGPDLRVTSLKDTSKFILLLRLLYLIYTTRGKKVDHKAIKASENGK